MKILFICRANVGRSQIAEAIFNEKTKKHTATSAGISPGWWRGKKLSITKCVAPCMKELGYNINHEISKKLNKKMIDRADKIIVMAKKEIWPEYLKKSDKVIFWNINDPATEDIEFHRKVRDKIKILVEKLIKNLK